ncbi:11-S seed storage protein [Thalictrum thalictroides]|uniref:11-S seed storage protein n=1 Tax=Thalictrum thalictroides TaxID=46969 RepID=A0A7J6URX5_THATH|nr:11-S seed storage protein [Thalictrum thalictroides]
MVQHLIERCLILRMTFNDCIKTLAERASIQPIITSTVWKELQKENKDFFYSYFHDNSQRQSLLQGCQDIEEEACQTEEGEET